jgi:ABC-2 type transport system permease protein
MMNLNLFFMEMRRNAVSLVTWMIMITILVAGTMFVYPTFVENQSKVMGFMALVPKAALQFKGFSNISALFSVLGFYAANNVVYMMLLGSIFSVVISSNMLMKEEVHRTAEYLFTWPVTRVEIFISKITVVVLNILLLNLITSLAGFTAMQIVSDTSFSLSSFLILSFYTFLLNLLFASAGLFLSMLTKKARSVTVFSIGMVMIFYFINTIARITESVSRIGYLSPFHYVRIDVTAPDYGPDPLRMMCFLVLILLFGMMSFRMFLKRDVYV